MDIGFAFVLPEEPGEAANHQSRTAAGAGQSGIFPSPSSPNAVPSPAVLGITFAVLEFRHRFTSSEPMDIREIAKRARVSTATVSRTINRVPTVNPALAKRVWSVIEELGYYPNTQARALVSGRSRIFGLIISEITNPFFPEIVQVFETIAVQHRYEILLTSTGNDPTRMESAVRRMIERRVEGVAILTFGMEEVLLEDLKLRKVPLVFVDVGPPRPRVSNIRIDYLNGIRQAVQHLAALRHENRVHHRPLRLKSAMARKQRSCAHDEIDLMIRGCGRGDHTWKEAWRLSPDSVRPTAVLCSNDMTVIGVMRESHTASISFARPLRSGLTTSAWPSSCCRRSPRCRCLNPNWPGWLSTRSWRKWSAMYLRPTEPTTCSRQILCCASPPVCLRVRRSLRKSGSETCLGLRCWALNPTLHAELRSIWREACARLGQARALCTPDASGLKSFLRRLLLQRQRQLGYGSRWKVEGKTSPLQIERLHLRTHCVPFRESVVGVNIRICQGRG